MQKIAAACKTALRPEEANPCVLSNNIAES